MHVRRFLMIPLFGIGLAACGSSGGAPNNPNNPNNPNPNPINHTLAQGQAETFSAGGYYGYEFLLPNQGQVSFSVSETTTDTWNVALFSNTEWVSYQTGSSNQAYGAIHNNVSSAADMASLPSGDWYLGFKCTNVIERCMLVFNLDAVY